MVMVKIYLMAKGQVKGAYVEIDIDEDASRTEIKRKLAKVTNVPEKYQKLLLTGIGQIWMGDKRSNIRFSSVGDIDTISAAVHHAKEGIEPFNPKPSFNRVDNNGTWVEEAY